MTSPMSSPLDGNGVALKPCPFRGGEPRISTYETESLWSHNQVTYTKVECPDCEVSFQTEPGYDPEAIDAWNRRSPASSQTAVEPVAWMRVEVQTHPNSPSRTELTIDPVLAKMWAFNEYTKSLTPLVPLSTLTAQAAALVAAEKERDEAWGDLSKVAGAIGSVRFMDPPDGGDVTLAEQVARMREALEAAEARIAELEAGLAFYASKANYADVPLQQWFRENEGKDAPTGYRCGNIDISAKPGHAIAPIFADLGDLARRLTHQEKNNGR